MSQSKKLLKHKSSSQSPTTQVSDAKLIFTRNQIESVDISPIVFFLMNNTQDANAVWSLKNRVSFKFSGYEGDKRELWEIPEVQRYMKRIFIYLTEWIFFPSLNDETLLICVLCLTNAKKNQNSDQISLDQDAMHMLNAAFQGMDGLFESQGFTPTQRSEVEMAAIQHLSVHLTPRLLGTNDDALEHAKEVV